MCDSCVSLKFAVTHTSCSGTIAIKSCPMATLEPDLHRAFAHNAVDRSRDGGVREVELGLVESGLGAQRLRVCRIRFGLSRCYRVGSGLRVFDLGISLFDPRLRHLDLCLRGQQ